MYRHKRQAALSLKRLFDIIISSSALLSLSPLIAVICAAIKVDDGGPVDEHADPVVGCCGEGVWTGGRDVD